MRGHRITFGAERIAQVLFAPSKINKMKTKKLFLKSFFALALASMLGLAGCKKDEASQPVSDLTSAAADFEQGEQIGNDIDRMADDAYLTSTVNLRLAGPVDANSILSCAVVTRDTVNRILTIDFGSGCTGNDGRTRSGQVIIQYNGHYFDPGFSRSVSFNNYFVDSNQVTGTRAITNNGFNGNGNLTWTIQAQNIRITKPNGYYHEWNSTRTRELVAGLATPNSPMDDVYLITGSGSSMNSHGNSTSVSILLPLRKEMSCHWIVSGTVEVTPSSHPVRTLDYGNGGCDHFATVTVNGITRTLILH